MREVAQRAALKIEFVPVDSWAEIYAPLENGSADVLASMGISEARKKIFEFTEPYEVFDIKIFIRNESEDIKSINDLKGASLGVQSTNVLTKGLVASGDYQIRQYPSYELALLGLLSGEVDAVSAPTGPFLLIARRAKLDDRIRFVGPSLLEVKRAMGFPKGRIILRDKLNRALLEFKQTDDYKNLLTKWYGSAAPYWTTSKLSVLMGAIFTVFLCLILLWRYDSIVKLNRRISESEERFEISHKFSNTGTWEYKIKSGDLYWSTMIGPMFGGPGGNLINSYEDFVSAIHPEDREFVLDAINACIENDKKYDATYRVVWPDGTIRWLAAQGKVFRNSDGEAERMVGVVQDISELKKIEDQLLTQSHITTNMEEGAALIRVSDQTIVYTNPAFDEMFGYEPGAAHGQHVSILHAPSDISPEVAAAELLSELEAKGVWRGEIHTIKKDGALFWSSLYTSAFDHPVYGKVWVSVLSDISERKLMHEKLSYEASHDSLTGLISRYEFENRVTRLLSSVSNDPVGHAMCFLDLDQFKVINDTCGHAAGDELLRQLGRLLDNTVRKRDTLARLGGDEFGVLMEHCTLEQAHRTANNILETIMDHQFFWDGKTFRVGVSIGLVEITEAAGNFTNLFQQADAACYLAKDLGRNRIHAYHPDDTELAARHGEMQWVGRIQQALDEDRFCLYAQPIVSLDSDDVKHYEVLVRMLGEQDEIIPPGAFLPAAERYNLIEGIDTWVVEHVISLMTSHSDFVEIVTFISINLSGQSVSSAQFMLMVIALITESKIDASKICFEVTETAAISNLTAANTFIATLKDLGCRFALDDFGSGLSSFGYLKNLPVDYLKIDGMFVKDMVEDPIDKAMVKSINDIGHVMGMQTIAEFVENDAIMERLKAIGIDYAQGYGIGKPEPFSDVISQFENV